MEHSNSHIIKKQVLDIKLPAHFKESDYYSAIKDLYYNQILPRLEKIAEEFDPEILYQIDALNIDLGTMPISSLLTEFPEKIEKSFLEMLNQAVTEHPNSNENVQIFAHKKDSHLEILSYFLTTGELPWQIKDKQAYNINSLLTELHQQTSEELKQLIIELSENQNVIERIQHQFNAESLKLIEQILYNPLKAITSFLQTGLLPWWVADKGTFDINTHFLKAQKQKPAELKQLLIEISPDPEVISRIQKQFSKETLEYIEHILYDPGIILATFLETGNLPWWAFDNKAFNINTLLLELKDQDPSELKKILVKGFSNPEMNEKIYSQFSEECLKAIEEVLEHPMSILEFFLRTGNLPPLVTIKEKSFNLDKLLKQTKDKNYSELDTMISQLISFPDVLSRILYQFNDESVVIINNILEHKLPIEPRHVLTDLLILCDLFESQNYSAAQYNRLLLPFLAEIVTDQMPMIEFVGRIAALLANSIDKPILDLYLELLLSIAETDKLAITKSDIINILEIKNNTITTSPKSISTFLSKKMVDILIKSYQGTKGLPIENNKLSINSWIKKTDSQQSKFQEEAQQRLFDPKNEENTIDYQGIEPISNSTSSENPTNKPVAKKKNIAIPNIEESYIENAGMVLLWPYLSRFFENIQYTEQGQFKSIDFQKRAIHILHYLVWGEEQCPEYCLLLNKILCGYDILKPIELNVTFKEEEMKSALELLDAVVKNWPILKNTSANGLRQTFLQRQGVLRLQDNNWKLTVEQNAFDILMEQLPWPIGIIKLPWMNQILYVEWI